jgi:hypothetical protein
MAYLIYFELAVSTGAIREAAPLPRGPLMRFCLSLLAALLLVSGHVRADFIAIYTFDNPGALFADSSGHGNNGTPGPSAPTYTPNGYSNGGAQFTAASNQYFTAPININPSVLPNLSMGGWFNASNANATIRGLISADDGGFDRTIDIDTRNGGVQWSAFNGNGVVSGGSVTAGTWNYVAVSYSQSTHSMILDVNGNIITAITNFDSTETTNVTIGRNPNFDTPFDGQMDNVFLSNDALTAQQLENIREFGFPSAAPEPASLSLALIGLAGVAIYTRRRRRTV